MMFKRIMMFFTFALMATPLMFSFQNCSKIQFEEFEAQSKSTGESDELPPVADLIPGPVVIPTPETPPEPIPPIVDDVVCVEGKVLGIWLDPDQSGVLKDENYKGSIVSYSGSSTNAVNYGYYSYSAHPEVGPVPTGFEAQVFFYEGPDGLSLNFYANVDEGGSTDNQMDIDIEVNGNSLKDKMILSDDGGEFKSVSTVDDSKLYEGRFRYWNNTDGGVIGPLVGEDFKLKFKFKSTGDVQSANFYSAGGGVFALNDGVSDSISSFVIAYKSYQVCQ